jgi:hypothetical protein
MDDHLSSKQGHKPQRLTLLLLINNLEMKVWDLEGNQK